MPKSTKQYVELPPEAKVWVGRDKWGAPIGRVDGGIGVLICMKLNQVRDHSPAALRRDLATIRRLADHACQDL